MEPVVLPPRASGEPVVEIRKLWSVFESPERRFEVHKDLEELARRLKTTLPDLILSAIDDDFEDDLDAIRAERILREAEHEPEGFVPWEKVKEELEAKHAGTVQSRAHTRRPKGSQ